MTIDLGTMRSRLRILDRHRREYERRRAEGGGSLPRSDWWRFEYACDPYLLGCPDDRLALRFHDVMTNQTELGREGLIGLLPVDDANGFMRKFTHLLEEYGLRGGLPVWRDIPRQDVDYFADGGPIAARIFDGYEEPAGPILVKYGRREFVEPMLREGRIRISPASYYGDASHSDAVRDDEVSRIFCIPTWRERLDGRTYTEIHGHRVDYRDDDVVLPLVVPDYHLYSLCDQIYYRMPTDFDADAAVVIRDPVTFTQRVISAFLALHPGTEALEGPVTYYDPYLDYTKFKVPEMAKHFGYAYQREVRIAFRPRRRPSKPLEPVFLQIGSMEDYADLLSA